MPDDPRYEPESILPDVQTILTPTGVKPVGTPDAAAYFAEVVRNRDTGTDVIVPANPVDRYPVDLESVSWPTSGAGMLTLSGRDAAMVGVYHLLKSLTWQSFNLQKVLAGDERVAITRHSFVRKVGGEDVPAVYLDWPEWSNEDMPAQTALITSDDEQPWVTNGFNPELLDETIDRFGRGTMLRHIGQMEGPLDVVCLCAHKDIRRGLEARLQAAFAAERWDDRFGRRVVVPEYFGRQARYEIRGFTRSGGPVEAIGNTWPLTMHLIAEIGIVELVRVPGYVDGIGIDVVAE